MTPQILSVGLEDLIRSPPTGSLPLNTDAQGGIGFALLPNNHLNGVGSVAENFFIGSSLEVSAKSRDVISQLWLVRMQLHLPRFLALMLILRQVKNDTVRDFDILSMGKKISF